MKNHNESDEEYIDNFDEDASLQILINDLKALLTKQGFVNIYDWYDEPNTKYIAHEHKEDVTMYIVQGEFLLKNGALEIPLYAGAKFKVPLNSMYTAEVGPEGCRYVLGEMIKGDFVTTKF